jgi:4-hydroxy-tetrahydrodipicolinate reductase
MSYKVIQWSTGNVGTYALRAIINHPQLELVGLIVHNPEKVGKDASDLCGLDVPTGVLATDDAASLLASGADCVCYTAGAENRMFEAVEDLAQILRAGINVVSSSMVMLVYPECDIAEFIEPIRAACDEGKVSFLTTGIDPGFANDTLPLTLTALCEHWSSVRIQEIVNYATYEQADTVMNVMGFGQPLDSKPYLLEPGVLSMAWGGTIRALAAGLGLELDEIRDVHERIATDVDLHTPNGVVAAGTMGALRFEIQGIVDGKPAVIVEHITRMSDDIAPDWPQGKGYTIIIEGEPRMVVTMNMEDCHGDHAVGGVIQTATRLVNAIEAVVEHEPGTMSALDLPMITGKGLYRPVVG